MANVAINSSAGVNLDDVFDPFVEGTQLDTSTGWNDVEGNDIFNRYAPLSFGAQAAVTRLNDKKGRDLNQWWAAKGTASYALPINGQEFSSSSGSGVKSTSCTCRFYAASSGWSISGSSTTGGPVPSESGSIPGNAVSVMYSYTVTDQEGQSSVNNTASTVTPLSTGGFIELTANSKPETVDGVIAIALTITFYNASGNSISVTNIQMSANAIGSA